MADKEIRRTIRLDGEKQYNQAIREATRNLRTLQSAMKAETAELGANATAQQKAEVRARSLREQIKEQEKVVRTLQTALEQAKEQYGDNADVVQRWERQLNNARTTLANMNNDLGSVDQTFVGISRDAAAATVATRSMAESLKDISQVGESVSSAIENVFTSMISTVSNAVAELWGMISETAARANEYGDVANYWGTNAQTIQQWSHAVGDANKSFGDLQGIVSRLVLGGKDNTITELLHISRVNFDDDWAYAMACMDEMYRMADEGQDMHPIYEQIFGERKSQGVMDLLSDWDEIRGNLETFNGDNTGYGMTSEGLERMSELSDRIASIEEKWIALKDRIAEGFAPVALKVTASVEGALDGIAAYLNAEDDAGREAALAKIRENVETFFHTVADFIRDAIGILSDVGKELQQSEDPLTSMIGNALVGITEAFQWIIDNKDAVIAALEAIFGLWLVAKVAALAGQIAGIVANVQVLRFFGNNGGTPVQPLNNGSGQPSVTPNNNGGNGGTPIPPTTGPGGTPSTAPAAGASGVGFWATIKAGITNTALSIGPQAALAGMTYGILVEQNRQRDQIDARVSEAAEAAREAAEGVEEATVYLDTVNAAAEALGYQRGEGGEYETGFLGARRLGDMGKVRNVLNGLDRTEAMAIMAQYGPEAILGYSSGAMLERFWNNNDLSMAEETALLEAVQQAYAGRAAGVASGEGLWALKEGNVHEPEMNEEPMRILERVEEAAEAVERAYSVEEADNAVQNWWDAWAAAYDGGGGSQAAEEEAFNRMLEILGDGAYDVYDAILERTEGYPDGHRPTDIPADWWMSTGAWTGASQDGITSSDLQSFRALPASIKAETRAGVREGIRGIRVTLDGREVGHLIASYVSAEIARDIE